ncbi:hypothetical protein WJ92_28000 [Burkholderia ubonensis]|nr:hypothetical protein WJ92_28000 [Burkholderia ubonensis]KWB13254.1 hypothetical protein WL31_18850 [Burkholderia ubonensis]
MTLRELRKRLREDTLSPQSMQPADAANVNSRLALQIEAIASSRGAAGERLRQPSSLMPLLP